MSRRLKLVRPSHGYGAFGLTLTGSGMPALSPTVTTALAPTLSPTINLIPKTLAPLATTVTPTTAAQVQDLAQNATVDQLKTLPSPIKEVAVAAAIVQGRPDVIQAATTQLNPAQVASLPSAAAQIIQVQQQLQPQVQQQLPAIAAPQPISASVPEWGVTLQNQTTQLSNFYATVGDTLAKLVQQQAAQASAISDLNKNLAQISNAVAAVQSMAQQAQTTLGRVDLAPLAAAISRHEDAINQIIDRFVASWTAVQGAIQASTAKITGAR